MKDLAYCNRKLITNWKRYIGKMGRGNTNPHTVIDIFSSPLFDSLKVCGSSSQCLEPVREKSYLVLLIWMLYRWLVSLTSVLIPLHLRISWRIQPGLVVAPRVEPPGRAAQ